MPSNFLSLILANSNLWGTVSKALAKSTVSDWYQKGLGGGGEMEWRGIPISLALADPEEVLGATQTPVWRQYVYFLHFIHHKVNGYVEQFSWCLTALDILQTVIWLIRALLLKFVQLVLLQHRYVGIISWFTRRKNRQNIQRPRHDPLFRNFWIRHCVGTIRGSWSSSLFSHARYAYSRKQ